MEYTYLDSPIGQLLLAGSDHRLHVIGFEKHGKPLAPQSGWRKNDRGFAAAKQQLCAYFAGELTDFDLPLAPRTTPFQARVLAQLRKIPYGTTISYGELARRIDRPTASRAVGAANGRNPLPIVIPCHRVIGANGSLTGFGGGLEVKRWLLALEKGRRGLRHAATGEGFGFPPMQRESG